MAPYSPSTDAHFVIFSGQALEQAQNNDCQPDRRIVRDGKYVVLRNQVSGTRRGFHQTPVGQRLEKLAREWNRRIYQDPNVDGFDFRLRLAQKPDYFDDVVKPITLIV